MANAKNIQKVIDVISKDDGTHFRMGNWCVYVDSKEDEATEMNGNYITKYIDCGTAFCIAGHANLIRLEESGSDPKSVIGSEFFDQFNDDDAAAGWLGISDEDAEKLFGRIGLDRFDAKTRRLAGIAVLEYLRDTGKVDWNLAITKAWNDD